MIAKAVEAKHRTRVKVNMEEIVRVVIHALNESDAQECWAEMEEHINSKLMIDKFIKLTQNQLGYLEIKCSGELENMKSNCESLFILKVKQGQAPSIKLRGTVNQVAAIEEQLNSLLDGYGEEEFEVSTTMYSMWSKRWRQLREDWDDTVLLFDQKATDLSSKQPHNPSDPTTVTFTVCGCNPEGIQRVKSMILTQESGNCVQTKTLELPPNGVMALFKGLKEKQFDIQNIAAEIEVNKISNTVTITSPHMASDDMIKMEETILSYIGDHSLETEIMSFSDPLVGLILTSPKYKYSDQLKAIAQPYDVRTVIPKYPKGELSLTGSQQSICAIKHNIQQLLEDIAGFIGQRTLTVECRFAPVFATKDFHLLCARIQEEFGVVCSPPFYRHQNATLMCELLPPPSQLQLEIVRGSLSNETVGAILTTSSESMGGALPTWVLEVGGPSIQAEFENHIQTYGRLMPGDAMWLGGGELPCGNVIHTMLSQWKSENQYTEEVSSAIYSVFTLAQEKNVDIVALPAIGTEVCGVPEQVCARVTLEVIRQFFLEAGPAAKIHTVRCVLDTQASVDAFLSSLRLTCASEDCTPRENTPVATPTPVMSKDGLNPTSIFKKYVKPFLSIFKQTSASQPSFHEHLASLGNSTTTDPVSSAELIVKLKGPKTQLDSAAEKILHTLQGSFSIKWIPLPSGDCRTLERRLEGIAQRHCVACSHDVQIAKDGKKENVLVLEGSTISVEKTIRVMEGEIDEYLRSAESAPPEWKPQNKITEVFTVSPGTPEWLHVFQRFQHTMPRVRVTSIQRIQNTWLWERYVQHKKRLHSKNNGVVNEMELFHGTRNNDPKLIYEGEDGFDMRYSAQGMWGMANYFAVNASYSHKYAHVNTATGKREMFLVKVLTGESYKCASDRSLRMPPPKPITADPNNQLQFGQMKYDTVTGETKGSQVFMAYDNEKAYPAYLIQY